MTFLQRLYTFLLILNCCLGFEISRPVLVSDFWWFWFSIPRHVKRIYSGKQQILWVTQSKSNLLFFNPLNSSLIVLSLFYCWTCMEVIWNCLLFQISYAGTYTPDMKILYICHMWQIGQSVGSWWSGFWDISHCLNKSTIRACVRLNIT